MTTNPLRTKAFSDRLAFLKESETWSKSEFEAYQLKELQQLISYVQKNIPYYEKLFERYAFSADNISSLEDLKRIPILTKADIQGRYEEFIPKNIDINTLVLRTTGGSTGTPLSVYSDLDFLSRDKANTVYYMEIAGYNPFDFRSLRIYGDKIPQEVLDRHEYWHEKENKLIMSCYHFSEETFPLYVNRINQYQPDYIHSRPSALLPLTRYLIEDSRTLDVDLGAIYLDGEFLSEAQRELIEQAFRTRVYNIFGHTEGCAVGISCQESRLLHFMPQIGILELLDSNGNDIHEEGKKGELVVTGFNNRMFPLIRYRTLDMGVHTKADCPCGRKYRMLQSLEGRIQDFVVNNHGQLVPFAPAVFNYNDMDWRGIRQFQVEQEKEGELLFKIQRETNAIESQGDMQTRLILRFSEILGSGFSIAVKYVQELPRTQIGKFRYLDQKLNIKDMVHY